MFEQEFDVPTTDGKTIYLVKSSLKEQPNNKAVLLCHGLTGHPNEHLHLMARNFFIEQGYDVFRLAFYWFGPTHRVLHETSLKIHADDVNTVIAFMRECAHYTKIFSVGHSYGGLTQLLAEPQVNAISFWDTSFVPDFWDACSAPLAGTEFYVLRMNSYHLIGQQMILEAKAISRKIAEDLALRIRCPSQIILAEFGEDTVGKNPEMLFKVLQCEKELITIKGADHCFTREHTAQTLIEQTYRWFERF